MNKIALFSKQILLFFFFIAASFLYTNAQTILTANGTTDTYTLINSVLAPGYTAIESPDSFHPAFGPHITQVYDATLGKSVFKFWIHVSETNELQDIATGSTDRQRNEIKTYDPSPDNLKGTYGETVIYKWRFQVPVSFQPSTGFTHIHQIKAVGGDDDSPLFTLTPRKGSPNTMQLIHNNVNIVSEVNLSLFEGVWVEATQTIRIDSIAGTYSMIIKKVSDNSTILSYTNNSLMTIRGANAALGFAENTYIRPKWGIYRSVANLSDLRDETLLFDNFSIQELTNQTQTITFLSLPASVYGDANFSAGATASSGMSVTYSSSNTSVATIVNDSIHIVGVGSSNITATQTGDATYASASSMQTLTVTKADQSIAFSALTKAVGDADFSPATASSDLAVSYSSSNTSVATIVSGKIHVVGVGTSTITASQAGNSNYNAASDVLQTLTITSSALYVYSPTSTTILFGTINSGTYSSLATNNAAYYRVNSTTSGTRKTDWYGSVTISQDKSSISKLIVNYDGRIQLSKIQVLYLYNFTTSAWVQIDSRTVSSSDISISYETSSPADYISSGGEIRLRVYTSGGSTNYSSSGDFMQFTLQNITKSDQIISFASIPEKSYGIADFSPAATSSSSLAVSYSSSNTAVATIVNNQIHIVGVGTSTITASQSGDAYTNAATDVSQTLTVVKTNQTITFGALTAKYVTNSDFSPGATVSSGQTLSYASSNTAVATIVSGNIHLVGVGTTIITTSQAGDANYNAASSVSQTLYVVANTGLFNETFNYTDGGLATNGGYTEAGTYAGGTGRTIGGMALTYTDAGGSYVLSGAGKSMTNNIGTSAVDYYHYKAFTASTVSTGIVYLSFLMKANANISPSNQEVMGLSNGTSAGPKVLIGKTTTGFFKIGTVRGITTSTEYKYAASPTSLTVGTTYLIVLKYDFATSTSSVYINPTLGGTEPVSPEISDNTSSTTRSQLNNLWFRGNGTTLIQNYDLSSARVSTSWTEAVAKYTAVSTYTITPSSANASMGTVSGGGTVPSNTSVSVVATPLSGYRFVNWTENGSEVSTNATYTFSASATKYLVANFAILTSDQTITFNALPTKTVGDADFAPGATASSGLTVLYASSNTAVATIVSGNINVVGAGTSTITASQAGNASYNAATDATQTLTVNANPILIDETFNYTDGALSGQGSWTEAGTHDGAGRTVASPALTYNNGVNLSYINSGEGKAFTNVIAGTAADYKAYKPFNGTSVNSGILYLSFILKVNEAVSSTNQEAFGLADGTSAGPKVLIGKTSTGFFKIGTVRGSSASLDYKYAASPTSLAINTAHLIVLKYDFSTNISSVYVNPTLGGTEPVSPEISDNTSTTIRTQLSNLWSRAQGTVVQNYSVGGVRVSTNWASAVATTTYTPPVSTALTAPTTGTATSISSGGFTARWTNNDANAIGYTVKVYWGTTFVDSTYVSGQTTTSLAMSNLVPGLTYSYKVLAVGDGTYHSNSALSTESASFTLLSATIPANNLKIILKLDDLGVLNSVFAAAPAFDYMKVNNIKWGAGAIANRFDGTSLGVLSTYINATNSVGDSLVEVWNHGYDHSYNSGTGIYEFSGNTYSVQKTHFDNATQAVKTYLGVQMHSFGTPYNASDANTNTVIGEDANYKVMMFSDVISATNGVTYLDNRVNMESATGSPEYAYFVDNYNAAKAGYTNYMILQGHPNYYTTGSSNLEQFKLIIQYLISQGCEFVRPYDYYRSLSLTAPTNLSVSSVLASQVNLSWSDNTTSEVNYKIERSTDNSTWSLIGTAAQNGTTYSDNAVVSGTTYYYYRVYANCGIKSAYSSTVQARFVSSSVNASALTNVDATSNIAVAEGNTLTIDQNTTLNKLTVAAGGKITLANTKSLTVSALTLESSATSTATFVDENTSGSTITATVQQYLTAGRNWYVASPVNAANAGALSTATTVYYYNEPTLSWVSTSATLNPMQGYISKTTTAKGVVSFSGILNSGEKYIDLTRTNSELKSGFNLIGNPYPSYLNWDAATKTNVNSSLWYRSQLAGNSTYVFDTYNATSHVGTGLNGTTVTAYIPPMQSFWVRVSEGFTTGRVTVNNSMRSHGTGTNKLKAPAITQQSLLRLVVSNGTNSDETLLVFNPNASNNYDDYDSQKMTNANSAIPELFTNAESKELVINGLNSFTIGTEIPLGFRTGEYNNFSIRASEISNFDSNTRIVLKDNILVTETDLTNGAIHTFTSDVINNSNRFSLVFKVATIVTPVNSNATNNQTIIVNSANELILSNAADADVKLFNSIGQLLEIKHTTTNPVRLHSALTSGIYFLTIKKENTISKHKIRIQ